MTVRALSVRWLAVVASALVAMPLFISTPATAVSGGPDSYGYIWVDSNAPSPVVTYNYADISSSGSRLGLPDDGCTFEVSLNFQFRYYGTIVSSIYICSDGFITFGVPDSYKADPPIPDPASPNNRVVALGIDLNPAALGSGGVYVKSYPATTPRRFIIAWDKVYKTYTAEAETFEIILEQNELWKDGRILIQYESLNDLPSSPLVGIENSTGSSGLAYPGPLGNRLAVAFLPPTDASLPPDFLQVSGSAIAPPTTAQGSTDVPMMQIDFSVPTNDVMVRAVEVTLSGLSAGGDDMDMARLWLDGGDGAFTPGPPDTALAESRFGDVSLVARLSCSFRVTMATSVRVFISYDINSTAGAGDWIGARLAGASSISVEYPDKVSSVGLPFDTYAAGVRTQIVASQDTLMLTGYTPLAPTWIVQWATDVPMLSMRLDANQNFVDLTGMVVVLGGNVMSSDIWAVKLLRDIDGNLNYTPGTDVVLAVSKPSGSPASAALSFSLRIFSGSPDNLLILIDVAPFAVIGRVTNLAVSQSGILQPGGSVDNVSGTNFPAKAGISSIIQGQRPALNLSWSDSAPRPDGIWMENEYLLDPDSTVPLDLPAGNGVSGYLTAENNGTHLFAAIDVENGMTPDPADGVAIGFDTDADGNPTPNADDAFAVNATEGWHLQYSSGPGTWISIGSCLIAPPTGDVTIPSCAAGFGATSFSTAPHRFYEFAIPLSFLGISLPIPPGAVLRFALGAPPYNGLLAAGSRSTWPLLFAPLPPLSHFGNLILARGAPANQPPALDWVGDSGYVTDGLEPESGSSQTTFLWRISYSDPDDNPPAYGQPLLHVLRGGVEVTGGPFLMTAENTSDHDFRDGYVYKQELAGLQCGGSFSYFFSVRDSRGLANSTWTKTGPIVYCPDQPPVLSDAAVSPTQGIAGDTFTYHLVYRDAEGVAPISINVSLFIGDVHLTTVPLGNLGWIADPGNYSAGAIFGTTVILTEPGLNYSYQFDASDSNNTVFSVIMFGPYVLARPPDILSVTGADLAPIIVDEGAKLVPFLQLFLFTSDSHVNVTGIRVDRTGTASDADAARILMYNDLDRSGSLTAPDQLLGAPAPSSGKVTFAVSLHVTQADSAALLLLIDFASSCTADATVGLEVKDSSYVTVESGDSVQLLATNRSTLALINVPPEATGLAVDGYSGATEGIGHIRSLKPRFEWQFQDPNSNDMIQNAYNISVSSGPTVLWFLNATGIVNSIVYDGPALTRGNTYLMNVSVFDRRVWSDPESLFFRINTPPPVPPPSSPPNGTMNVDSNVTLVWNETTDVEGDSVIYHYWVSEDEGFGTSINGTTTALSVLVSLSGGTTYFWRLGASDGWNYQGNETIWHFSTSGVRPPSTRGEVQGRVVSAGAPFSGALVELLAIGTVIRANITGSDGEFRFLNLDFRAYTVRVSAYGFETQTRAAEPRLNQTIVNLGDIILTRTVGGAETEAIPAWLLILVAALAIGFVILLGYILLGLKRRRRKESEKAAAAKGKKVEAQKIAEPDKGKPATPTQKRPAEKKAAMPGEKGSALPPERKAGARKVSAPGKDKVASPAGKKVEEKKVSEPGETQGKS